MLASCTNALCLLGEKASAIVGSSRRCGLDWEVYSLRTEQAYAPL